MLVGLTKAGAVSVAAMRAARQTRLDRILAAWSEDERSGFAGLLARFNAALLEADRASISPAEKDLGMRCKGR